MSGLAVADLRDVERHLLHGLVEAQVGVLLVHADLEARLLDFDAEGSTFVLEDVDLILDRAVHGQEATLCHLLDDVLLGFELLECLLVLPQDL